MSGVRKRGRPRKARPTTPELKPGMSQRDIETAFGLTRRQQRQALAVASLPGDEFEKLIEQSPPATPRALELLARRRTGKTTERERHCPNCGYLLRLEDPI